MTRTLKMIHETRGTKTRVSPIMIEKSPGSEPKNGIDGANSNKPKDAITITIMLSKKPPILPNIAIEHLHLIAQTMLYPASLLGLI